MGQWPCPPWGNTIRLCGKKSKRPSTRSTCALCHRVYGRMPLVERGTRKCRAQRGRALEHRSIRASADVPNCRAATPTAFHRAWPSRVRGSSTRLVSNSGVESRAARSCLAPKLLVLSANATVRSSRVLARLWAMSRMRKFSKLQQASFSQKSLIYPTLLNSTVRGFYLHPCTIAKFSLFSRQHYSRIHREGLQNGLIYPRGLS